MVTTIIGIDCAVDAKNTGLVRVRTAGETLVVAEARCGSRSQQSAGIVANWIRGADHSLLALDAPLGWPKALGNSLSYHRAGAPLATSAHQLFRRRTDDVIHGRLKRRSLVHGTFGQSSPCRFSFSNSIIVRELFGEHNYHATNLPAD